MTKDKTLNDKVHGRPQAGDIKYCRTCYDHLAGFVGVALTEALEAKGCLAKSGGSFLVTRDGWEWLRSFNISEKNFESSKRPLARQCIDGTQRRPHLAGQLGALLLTRMFERGWFKRVGSSRVIVVTERGRRELKTGLNLLL